MTQEEAQEMNFNSRLETLTAMFKRYKEILSEHNPYNAVHLSTPLCDFLIMEISRLQAAMEEVEVNNLINNAFKSEQ